MTQTIQSPLTKAQEARAAALTLAANAIHYDRPLDDLLDVADFILGPPPCPLAGLKDPIFFDIDLGTISHELIELMVGTPAPAEPDVYAVGDAAGVESLPVGSVLHYPNGDYSYVKVATNDWRRATRDGNDLMLRPRCQDRHMVTEGNPDWPIAAYIPGGV